MSSFDVDLFVIGGGSGGVRAARIAAGYGARVMLAEEYRVGGTCVIRGCVPKKLLVYASRFADDFEDAAGFGWSCRRAPLRLGDPDPQQGQGDRPARGHLPQPISRRRASRSSTARAVIEDAHTIHLLKPESASAPATSWSRSAPIRPWSRRSRAANSPSPRTRSSISRRCRGASWWSAAAISRSSSPASSPGSAARSRFCIAASKLLRGFDEDVRDALGEAYAAARHQARPRQAAHEPRADAPTASRRACRTARCSRSTRFSSPPDGGPTPSGLGLENAGIDGRRGRRHPRRRLFADPRSPRSMPSATSPTGPTSPRSPSARAMPSRTRSSAASRPSSTIDLIPTAVFSTPEIGVIGCSEAAARDDLRRDRRLQDRLPAHEGDAFGRQGPGLHEAHRRQGHRQGASACTSWATTRAR